MRKRRKINFKSFLISVISGITAWAITGCISGFTSSNPILTIISIIIIVFFLVFIILNMALESKDNNVRVIEKASRDGDWLQVYTLGGSLSTVLWKMSKLKSRVRIAEKYKESINILNRNQNELNDKPFDYNEKMATIHIDDLGYTNYMLANDSNDVRIAISNINVGKDFAENINNNEKKLSLKLKALRHLLAIYNDGRYPQNGESPVKEFYYLIRIIEEETASHKKGYLYEQLQCAYYALYKYEFFQNKNDSNELQKMIDKIRELGNIFASLHKNEWQEKCEQLIWEIQCNKNTQLALIETNIGQISNKLNKNLVWPNRRIKILDLYIKYISIKFKKSYSSYDNIISTKEEVNRVISRNSKLIKQSENKALINQLEQNLDLLCKNLANEKKRIKNRKTIYQYDVFLFDCDYTIYNYKKAQEKSLKKTLKYFSIKYHKKYAELFKNINEKCWIEYQNQNQYDLIRTERVRRFLLEIKQFDVNQEQFLNIMEYEMEKPILMPGAKKFLKICKKNNKKIFIVTDAEKKKREKILEPLVKKEIISSNDIFSKEDCGYSKKESGFFKELEKRYEIEAGKAIIFGDSFESDLEMAAKNGYSTCLVNIGYKYKTGAFCTQNLDEITYVIKKLQQFKKLKWK